MAAKEAGLAERISGWDDRATIEEAMRRGVIVLITGEGPGTSTQVDEPK